ncbi:MAG: zinc ribbon domain-containing protein [Treponema sp.]|nr:zinc ribbon domain-containing protein [Treponema sp.]
MNFCTNCGEKLTGSAKFCASCGTQTGGAAQEAPRPATEKVGNIRKCPACGAEVQAMTAICSLCGLEFSNVKVSSTVQAFFEKLDAIQEDIYQKQSEKEANTSVKSAIGSLFAGSLGGAFMGASAGAKRQIGMIEGFPIPNSKEDIMEFVLIASGRYRGLKKPFIPTGYDAAEKAEQFKLDDAWRIKCGQAYTKAKITFGSDKEAINQIEMLLREKKIIK